MEIYAQGAVEQVDGFLKDLEERPPKRAAILKINMEEVPAEEAPQQVQLINGCRYRRFFGSYSSSLHSSQIAISGETKISPFVFSLSIMSVIKGRMWRFMHRER